jgi:hypothetical protein
VCIDLLTLVVDIEVADGDGWAEGILTSMVMAGPMGTCPRVRWGGPLVLVPNIDRYMGTLMDTCSQ